MWRIVRRDFCPLDRNLARLTLGDRRGRATQHLHEAAADMAPAMDQRPAAFWPVELLEPVVAVIGVALQVSPAAAVEESLGVEALAARGVAEDDDRGRLPAMGAVVGGHGPEEALLCLLSPRIEDRQRRLVHEQARRARQMDAHPLDDRLEVEAGAADPVAQGGSVEVDALAAEYLGLPVQGKMVGELGDDDLRDQRLGRQATGHDMLGRVRRGDCPLDSRLDPPHPGRPRPSSGGRRISAGA